MSSELCIRREREIGKQKEKITVIRKLTNMVEGPPLVQGGKKKMVFPDFWTDEHSVQGSEPRCIVSVHGPSIRQRAESFSCYVTERKGQQKL